MNTPRCQITLDSVNLTLSQNQYERGLAGQRVDLGEGGFTMPTRLLPSVYFLIYFYGTGSHPSRMTQVLVLGTP